VVGDSKNNGHPEKWLARQQKKRDQGINLHFQLNVAVKMWSTPKASDGTRGDCPSERARRSPSLISEVKMWQTPVADDAVDRKAGKVNSRGEPKLSTQVKMWPTPVADGDRTTNYAQGGTSLGFAVRRYPTPCATDYKTGYPDSEAGRAQLAKRAKPLRDQVAPGGSLNPVWVEWLMGWPLGWTDLQPLETARFQQWLTSHGRSCTE
jgi:hypothetical protein